MYVCTVHGTYSAICTVHISLCVIFIPVYYVYRFDDWFFPLLGYALDPSDNSHSFGQFSYVAQNLSETN